MVNHYGTFGTRPASYGAVVHFPATQSSSFSGKGGNMHVISKKFMLVTLMVSVVSLSACGGGGGNTPLAPRPTISFSEITGGMPQQGYLAEDYSNTGDSGGLEATLKNDGLIATDDTGQPFLAIKHGNSIEVIAEYGSPDQRVLKEFQFAELPQFGDAFKPELVVGIGDMTDETAAFLEEPKRGTTYHYEPFGSDDMHNDPNQGKVYFTGTALGGTEFIALNSGLVDLAHASFGAWGVKTGFVGTMEWNGKSKTHPEDDPFEEITFIPVSGGNPEEKAIPAANTSFTGKAFAMATQYRGSTLDDPLHKIFTGDARLSIDSTGRSGNLAMSFPDFYDIGFKFNVVGDDGGLQGDGLHMPPTIRDNGNKTEFHFPNRIEGSSLSGNFYGENKTASEASGRFEISGRDNPTDDLFIFDGSFGVKK